MILGYYVRRWLSAVLAIGLMLSGLLTFGYPEYFDRLVLFCLIALASFFIYKKDVSFAGVLVILLFGRLADELVFFSYAYSSAKGVIYLLAPIVLYQLRYDKLVRYLCAPIFLFSICAEVYWLQTDYDSPALHFIIAIMLHNMISKHLFFMRVPLTKKWLQHETNPLSIDWICYLIDKWTVILLAIILVEYLIRHFSTFQLFAIYDVYTPTIELISVFSVTLIINHLVSARYNLSA